MARRRKWRGWVGTLLTSSVRQYFLGSDASIMYSALHVILRSPKLRSCRVANGPHGTGSGSFDRRILRPELVAS